MVTTTRQELNQVRDELQLQTPQAMNTMFEKESPDDAKKKFIKRKQKETTLVPPTIPGICLICRTYTQNISIIIIMVGDTPSNIQFPSFYVNVIENRGTIKQVVVIAEAEIQAMIAGGTAIPTQRRNQNPNRARPICRTCKQPKRGHPRKCPQLGD